MKAHPALFGGGGVGGGGRGSQEKGGTITQQTLLEVYTLPSKHSWRFIRWSDVSPTTNIRHGILVFFANILGGLYVGPTLVPTTNIRHGILVVFANQPPVGPTTPVRRGGLLVGPTTPVQRGGLLVGPSVYCEGPPSFIWGSQGRGRG